jgi:aspartate dehydrogenase
MADIVLVGAGRIGGAVARWIAASPRHRLAGVIGRAGTTWPDATLAIDAAGPAALRRLGPRLLERGDLWTVGAAALADPGFRAEMAAAARQSGHVLRLFTGWIAGPALAPRDSDATLHILQAAPGLGAAPGVLFRGPLAEAVQRFPDHLNTACAAALTGPGIEATTVELVSSPPGGPHVIRCRFAFPGNVIETSVAFDPDAAGAPHPVAAALVAALERLDEPFRYG